jgi:hypothetical protein
MSPAPSLEFYLARLTARGLSFEPNIAPGSKPAITDQDIRAALSIDTTPAEFHALLAKYCADPISEREILDFARRRSAWRFLEERPTLPIRGEINRAIAESAVLYFVSPLLGQKRGDTGNAAHAGVGRNTWAKYYRDHFKAITAELFELERRGLLELWKRTR